MAATQSAYGTGLNPASAASGTYFAYFYIGAYGDFQTRLISPQLDLSSYGALELNFQHYMAAWAGDQDILKVFYRTSEASPWNELSTFDQSTDAWTQRTLSLPNLSSTYQLSFLGDANYGYGIAIDSLSIDVVPEPSTWLAAGFIGLLVAGRYGCTLFKRITSRS